MKKKIFSFTLACLLSFGCVSSLAGAAVAAGEYPELLITEISVDQYGDAANPLNKNPKYKHIRLYGWLSGRLIPE